MPKIAVEASGLSKKFGQFDAVKSIDFSVKEGEIFGFLGPNGAGKSTTINMLTTLLPVTGGRVTVSGFDVSRNPEEVRKRICLISQEGSADGDLTAEENLIFYGKLYHVPKNDLSGRVKRALSFVNLSEKKDVRVRFFSGGMRRRLEIAKVFVSDPKIVFLDEPTIGLDPQSREMIWKKVFEINRKSGITIFITTHYMQEAEALCNRIAIIDKGKIIAIGTPNELKKSIGISEICEFAVNERGEAPLENLLKRRGFSPELLSKGRMRVLSKKEGSEKIVSSDAKKAGASVSEFQTRRPNMEDVFLYYTGHDVRDSDSDGAQLTRNLAKNIRGG